MRKLFVGLVLVGLIIGLAWTWPFEEETTPTISPQIVEPTYKVSLTAVGDVMLARKVERLIQSQGPDYPFVKVRDKLKAADITFGNLESPLSERGTPLPGKGICFRARPEMSQKLQDSGFDVLSVANNHAVDYDTDAFLDTLELLRSSQIQPVGGGQNIDEARRPVIIEKNGLKVGFLAYTIFADIYYDARYRRTFRATETVSGVAPLEQELILEDLAELRPQVDVAIVSLHWGTEYSKSPQTAQRELGQALIDGGADLIIGHHPHIIQGFERYKDGLIAYSLGNFIFDQNQHVFTRQGLILDLNLTREGLQDLQVWPVFIKESQPYVMEGEEAQELLQTVQNLNRNLGTESQIVDNHLVL
jgi:poly-gamma-glutamate capsule biosynthesis protein CapA/YwtB (metallophosphatase superfamily)